MCIRDGLSLLFDTNGFGMEVDSYVYNRIDDLPFFALESVNEELEDDFWSVLVPAYGLGQSPYHLATASVE